MISCFRSAYSLNLIACFFVCGGFIVFSRHRNPCLSVSVRRFRFVGTIGRIVSSSAFRFVGVWVRSSFGSLESRFVSASRASACGLCLRWITSWTTLSYLFYSVIAGDPSNESIDHVEWSAILLPIAATPSSKRSIPKHKHPNNSLPKHKNRDLWVQAWISIDFELRAFGQLWQIRFNAVVV